MQSLNTGWRRPSDVYERALIATGDALAILKKMPSGSVNCCVTSPPYWGLRDYGVKGQLGLERTPEEYVSRMVEIFREVRRVLRDDGTLWLNLGDSYAAGSAGRRDHGSGDPTSKLGPNRDGIPGGTPPGPVIQRSAPPGLKPKDLVGIPWRVAFALQADGWYLRSDIIWHKPNPMPESVTDRPTKAHEYLFLLAKSERYYYDADAIKEQASQPQGRPMLVAQHKQKAICQNQTGSLGANCGPSTRNRRTVWTVTTRPFKGAHFATFPPKLIEPCILAGCPVGGVVLDPFVGAGTTLLVALQHGRNSLGIELNPEYVKMARARLGLRTGRTGQPATARRMAQAA